MKKGCMLAMLAMCAALLGGCVMKNIEAQAYAVALGADLTEDGTIEVSVQVPVLNQGGSSESGGENGGGGKGYTFSNARGAALTEALEMLNAGLTRELNLTGVKSIVVSEALARSDRFSEIFEELALSYRVYGAAEVVVCRGRAADFIQNQRAVIGLRLSESITVSLAHYRETGFIPSAKAADMYYLSHSIYSDPVAVLASDENGQAGGSSTQRYAGEMDIGGDVKNQYFGTALFAGGKMCGMLDGTQTQLLNVIRGDLKHFGWVLNGTAMRVEIRRAPQIEVDLSKETPVIKVRLFLNVMDSKGRADVGMFRARMLEGLREMTQYVQSCGAEPFGYAEAAAGQFATVEAWREYGWRTRFAQAQVEYEIEIKQSEI